MTAKNENFISETKPEDSSRPQNVNDSSRNVEKAVKGKLGPSMPEDLDHVKETQRLPRRSLSPPNLAQSYTSEENTILNEDQEKDFKKQDEMPILRFSKLCGAARKRYAWLLGQGHAPREARELALKPMPRKPNPMFNERPLAEERFKKVTEGVKLKILDANFSNTLLSTKLNPSNQDETPIPKIPKLSGAAKKRYAWLLGQGHAPREARELALKPMPRKPNPMFNERPPAEERFKKVTEGVKLRILDANFSNTLLSTKLNPSNQDKTPIPKIPKLSGAARKRFVWLLKQGHPPKEARVLALTPIPRELNPMFRDRVSVEERFKRAFSCGSTLEGYQKKKLKVELSYEVREQKNQDAPPQTTLKNVTEGVKLRIQDTNFPITLLSTEQMEKIENAILSAIVEDAGGSVSPSFHDMKMREGFMILTCDNQDTAEWLRGKQENFKPWEGANLRIMPEEDRRTVTASFPNSEEDSNEKILGYVNAQNKGLLATGWNVLQRSEEGKSVLLIISIDNASANKLEREGPWISYKFGKIQLKLEKEAAS